jgi:hypothetical protein
MMPFGMGNTLCPKSSNLMPPIFGKEVWIGFENPTEEGHP